MTAPRSLASSVRRVGASNLNVWVAAVALSAVFGVGLLVVGAHDVLSADEGAAMVQAESIASSDSWIVPHPVPEVDPDMQWYPLENSTWGTDGAAPFAKHPVYAYVVALSFAGFGSAGPFVVSMVSAVLAAVAAALLLTERREHRVWVVLSTVLATPLFFNGLFVAAHAMSALMCVLLVGSVVRAPRRPIFGVVALASALVLCQLRTEGAILVLAVGLVGAMVSLQRRTWWQSLVLPGAALVVVASSVLRSALQRAVIGEAQPSPVPSIVESSGFLTDRWNGFVTTVLQPDIVGGHPLAILGVMGMVSGSALIVLASRKEVPDNGKAVFGALLATIGLALRLYDRPVGLVPGLVPAAPWVVAAIASVRTPFGFTRQWFAPAVAALSCAGILATQYGRGGTAEWGWRYAALVFPLTVPLFVDGASTAWARLGRTNVAPIVLACALISVVGIVGMQVATIRQAHDVTSAFKSTLGDSAATNGLVRPVVLADSGVVARLVGQDFADYRFLLVPTDELAQAVIRLGEAGESRVLLITTEIPAQVLAYVVETEAVQGVPPWTVAVIDTQST